MYQINYQLFSTGAAAMPKQALHTLWSECTFLECRIYLYLCECGPATPAQIARATAQDLPQVEDALAKLYSMQLLSGQTPRLQQPVRQAVVQPAPRLTRDEVSNLAKSDTTLQFLLGESQNIMGRPLSPTESTVLASIYQLDGMPVDVLLMLISYCVGIGKATTNYIQRCAVAWLNEGIDTAEAADRRIKKLQQGRQCAARVMQWFGIQDRRPTQKEKDFCYRWIEEWGFDENMLKEAYDRCVNATGKVSFAYINSILQRWQKQGITDLAKLAKSDPAPGPKQQKASFNAGQADREFGIRMITFKKQEKS